MRQRWERHQIKDDDYDPDGDVDGDDDGDDDDDDDGDDEGDDDDGRCEIDQASPPLLPWQRGRLLRQLIGCTCFQIC